MQQLTLFNDTDKLPVSYHPKFLTEDQADVLLRDCKTLAWQQNQIHILGRPIQVPRLECMYGVEGAAYHYGSVNLEARPWTPELLQLRHRITTSYGFEFDIVVGNFYRNGQDSIGWHSDDEPSMGCSPAIASITLGACRKFSIKPKTKGAKATHFWLEHGSLFLMLPGCQQEYVHQLPKDGKCFTERINLTFRPYRRGEMSMSQA
jgi:alkylated DNA repair dioxygenase AlkB